MNVFVSQPMDGMKMEDILAERDRVKNVLKKMFPKRQINIIDNITDNITDNDGDMLGKDLSLIFKADYIFFTAESRRGHRGCEMEVMFAEYYNVRRIEEIEMFTDDGPTYGYWIRLPFGGAV